MSPEVKIFWSRAEVEVGESRQRVIELSEAAPPRIQQNELRAHGKRTRAKLEEAFKRRMSDAEAKLAAKGRDI